MDEHTDKIDALMAEMYDLGKQVETQWNQIDIGDEKNAGEIELVKSHIGI